MSNGLSASQLARIREYGAERCGGHDAAHDVLHVQRVVVNARGIVKAEQEAGAAVREDIVEAACWLHDLVQLPKGSGPAGESARRSAAEARLLLEAMGVEAGDVSSICHAVEAHSFSGGLKPQTLEAAIVQDADRLDALGAVGIARLWVTAAGLGSALYHCDDPAGTGRELDDRSYGLDHIARKLLTLPETMTTSRGKEEARQRAAYVAEFRTRMLSELAGGRA